MFPVDRGATEGREDSPPPHVSRTIAIIEHGQR